MDLADEPAGRSRQRCAHTREHGRCRGTSGLHRAGWLL